MRFEGQTGVDEHDGTDIVQLPAIAMKFYIQINNRVVWRLPDISTLHSRPIQCRNEYGHGHLTNWQRRTVQLLQRSPNSSHGGHPPKETSLEASEVVREPSWQIHMPSYI